MKRQRESVCAREIYKRQRDLQSEFATKTQHRQQMEESVREKQRGTHMRERDLESEFAIKT